MAVEFHAKIDDGVFHEIVCALHVSFQLCCTLSLWHQLTPLESWTAFSGRASFATHLAPPAASRGGLLPPHVDIDPSGVVVATICLFMKQVDMSVNW